MDLSLILQADGPVIARASTIWQMHARMRLQMSHALRRRTAVVTIALAIAVTQTILLWFLGVPISLQVAVMASAAIATGAGYSLFRPVLAELSDPDSRLAVSFLGGMVALTGLSYVLLHRSVGKALGVETPEGAVRLALLLLAVAGAVTFRRSDHRSGDSTNRDFPAVVALLAAIVLSQLTAWGYVNNTDGHETSSTRMLLNEVEPTHPIFESGVPEWGFGLDAEIHLVQQPAEIHRGGLPIEPVAHRGVPVWAMSAFLAFDDYDIPDPIQAAKVLAVPVWFSLLTLGWLLARFVFGLNRGLSFLAMAGIVLFGPIDLPLFDLSRSSYRGFIHSSGSLYHNAPQLYGVALGMACVTLLGLAVDRDTFKSPLFVAAFGAAAASFWFKPAVYAVLAPALMCVLALRVIHRRRTPLIAAGIVLAPLVWWVLYPRIAGVVVDSPSIEFNSLGSLETFAKPHFPDWIGSSELLLASAILLVSFAAWVLPMSSWAKRSFRSGKSSGRGEALKSLVDAPAQVTVVIALLLGAAAWMLLAEVGPRFQHGNLSWPGSAAYVLAIPLLVALTAQMSTRLTRTVNWFLIALHIWAGVLHLFLVVTTSTL